MLCLALLASTAALLLGACLPRRGPLGEQCELSSECDTPLVCSLGRCRRECASTRDCPIGALCVRDQNDVGVCLLDDEGMCLRDGDCPGELRCLGGACSEACAGDADCAPGAICVGEIGERRCANPSGVACVRSAECEEGLVCAADGRCRPPCRAHRDCPPGSECAASGLCVEPSRDGGVIDGGVGGDAAPVDGGASDAEVDGGLEDGSVEGGVDDAGAIDGGPSDGAVTDGGSGTECVAPTDCVAPNVAEARCAGGSCEVVVCATGFGDCDGEFATGCEIDLESDPAHCGRCSARCGLGGVCTAAACDTLVDVAVGIVHTCVVRSSGAVLCAGRDESGQLGRGVTSTMSFGFAPMRDLEDAREVTTGAGSTCALRAGGAASCAGDNSFGQVGDGTTTLRTTPRAVVGLSDAVEIASGGDYTRLAGGSPSTVLAEGFACARHVGGVVSCWGRAVFRGDGDASNTSTPVVVPSLSAVDLAAGGRHLCAARSDGTVACWGRGGPWLGPAGASDSGTPLTVSGIDDAVRVEAGIDFSCAVLAGGGVRCWGQGGAGQLGADLDGASASASPVAVVGLTDATRIALGSIHACALRADGSVRCWGSNTNGELGDGMASAGGFTPVDVPALEARALAAGPFRTCAIRTDGALACWGGDTTPTEHPDFPPTPVP
jgi:hypothetical protein